MGRRMFSEKQIGEMAKNVADQEVEELVEGGTLDNAKPIYWHGIEIVNTSGGQVIQMNVVLLLNDDTPINSISKFINKILSFGTNAFINIDGFYNVDGKNMCNATALYVDATNKIYLLGNDYECARKSEIHTGSDWITILAGISGIQIQDRINKLN